MLIDDNRDYVNSTWSWRTELVFADSFTVSVRTDVAAFAPSIDGRSCAITTNATGAAYEPYFDSAWGHVRVGGSAADFAARLRCATDDQTGGGKTSVLAVLEWQMDLKHPSGSLLGPKMFSSLSPLNWK